MIIKPNAMVNLKYRGNTILSNVPNAVARWKKKQLIESNPLNWLNPYFTIEKVK